MLHRVNQEAREFRQTLLRRGKKENDGDSHIGITGLRMAFVRQVVVATVLVTLTLVFQSAGMAAFIHWGRLHLERGQYRLGIFRSAAVMVLFTGEIVVLHMLQILLWAGFYRWKCFPSWKSAFYFSTGSYSTVGTGTLLAPEMCRNLGVVESITGVLMCGLSASLLFAIVTRLVDRETRFSTGPARPAVE